MEKKSTKIAYFVALGVFVVLLVILGITFKGVPLPTLEVDGEMIEATTPFAGTFWSLLPPIVAIVLALISKEVYSSLFLGCLVGALLVSNFQPWETLVQLVEGDNGIVTTVSDSGNIAIIVFLVVLGIMVDLMNKTGGSEAFGRWATKTVHTRAGAQLMTMLLGVLIFIDDYFNCLTVGSVMRPVTDKFKISRSKLAYFIDATAAPVCIIAPISSWAAAVSGYIENANGLELFVKCIPYNFYALLTIAMMITIILLDFDFGPMKKHEIAAREHGDLFSGEKHAGDESAPIGKGKVIDLVLPILVLIACCFVGLIYSGGMFDPASDCYGSLIDAFGNATAGIGLMLGSAVAIILTIIWYLCRKILGFRDCMDSLADGFKAMVPAILILTLAWTLNATTGSLGLREFVHGALEGSAKSLIGFLPCVVFAIGCGLAFATGTSWGTFGMLIPIVLAVFPPENVETNTIMIICMSASMAGAVMGDHCSPISDTTIMASAGAQCDHINHVSTQIPYAMLVAGVSFVMYLITGFVQSVIMLPIAIAVMVGVLFLMKRLMKSKDASLKA